MSTLMLFALNVAFLASLGSSFVLDGDTCIAYPPCTCSGDDVKCDSKGLTTFPTFRVSNFTGSGLYIDLRYNKLTTIPNNAFSNITVSNRTQIYLNAPANHISNIQENAFRGIENEIVELRLQLNNLAQVPSCFKRLTNLERLWLDNNQIKSLTSSYSTFYSLRYSLRTLSIDMPCVDPPWPLELNVLVSLTYLTIYNWNVTHLDYDTLQAFEDKLTSFAIAYSQLEKIPVLFCHLKNLKILTFSSNANIHINSSIFEPCSQKLTKVTDINLTNNKLRYMPNILYSFPSVRWLDLDYNELAYIDWDLVPNNSSLIQLDMAYNDFTRIPSAISKLTKLISLRIGNNKITSLEEFDFNTLTDLLYLHLNDNPIEYISPNAFKYNSALTQIDLKYTNIRKLPSSISVLRNLHQLDLTNCPIQCTCDLSFMKTLNFSRLSVDGHCDKVPIQIQTFLVTDIPHCP